MAKKYLSDETREKYINGITRTLSELSDGRLMELQRIVNEMYINDHALEMRALFIKEFEKHLKEIKNKES